MRIFIIDYARKMRFVELTLYYNICMIYFKIIGNMIYAHRLLRPWNNRLG